MVLSHKISSFPVFVDLVQWDLQILCSVCYSVRSVEEITSKWFISMEITWLLEVRNHNGKTILDTYILDL